MTTERVVRYTVAWENGDGRWRWAYVEETSERRELELVSHKEFLSKEEAERSARVAYPDVLVRQPERARPSRSRRLLGVLALAVLGLALVAWQQRHDRRRS